MRNYDSNSSNNDDNHNDNSPKEQPNLIKSTKELDKELQEEAITYFKLKNASKWNDVDDDDDDCIDLSKKEVTPYNYIYKYYRYTSSINYGIQSGNDM